MAALLGTALVGSMPGAVQAARHTETSHWATREGVSVRVLLMMPENPVGAVLLLPGGHGNINLDSQGLIGWGQDDFLVRTRRDYEAAGFIVVIPDVPSDRLPPAPLGAYRTSPESARDVLALVDHLHSLTNRVWIIAYDRGATSALNAAGNGRDGEIAGLVLVSPMLDISAPGGSALYDDAQRTMKQRPMLTLGHGLDRCSREALSRLQAMAGSGADLRYFKAVTVSGGDKEVRQRHPWDYYNDPCNRDPYHTLSGLEAETSKTILEWLRVESGHPPP